MSDDRFLDAVRNDARQLGYEPADAALSRIAARIRERIARPTIAELIAAWFRPLTVTVAALAFAASITLVALGGSESLDVAADPIEISMAEGVVSVGE